MLWSQWQWTTCCCRQAFLDQLNFSVDFFFCEFFLDLLNVIYRVDPFDGAFDHWRDEVNLYPDVVPQNSIVFEVFDSLIVHIISSSVACLSNCGMNIFVFSGLKLTFLIERCPNVPTNASSALTLASFQLFYLQFSHIRISIYIHWSFFPFHFLAG